MVYEYALALAPFYSLCSAAGPLCYALEVDEQQQRRLNDMLPITISTAHYTSTSKLI
jgi:hypothetical protein